LEENIEGSGKGHQKKHYVTARCALFFASETLHEYQHHGEPDMDAALLHRGAIRGRP
jgi:hypothetical protein